MIFRDARNGEPSDVNEVIHLDLAQAVIRALLDRENDFDSKLS